MGKVFRHPSVTKVRKERKRHARRVFWQSVFFLLLLVLTLYTATTSPFFAVKKVRILGNEQVLQAEIEKLASVPMGTNIFQLETDPIVQRLNTHPFVKEVRVKRYLPSTLDVIIQERKPYLIIPARQGLFIKVDKEGYILEKIDNISKAKWPLITGIEVKNYNPGTKINNHNFSEAVNLMGKMTPFLKEQMSELNVGDLNQIYLFTLNGIEIRLGKIIDAEEKMKELEQILTNKEVNNEPIAYIDLSYKGSPAIKYREYFKEGD